MHHRSPFPQRTAWLEEPLRAFLLDHEFFALPALNQYRQPYEDGFRTVVLSLTAYSDRTLCEVHLGIRLDRVENLVFPFTDNRKTFEPHSMTVLTPLARLSGQSYDRLEVDSPNSARRALRRLRTQLEEVGLPFLDAYSDVESMDALYNDEPERAAFLTHNVLHRCLRSLALAKLTDRPDYYDILRGCRQALQAAYVLPEKRRRFEDLARILPTYSEN